MVEPLFCEFVHVEERLDPYHKAAADRLPLKSTRRPFPCYRNWQCASVRIASGAAICYDKGPLTFKRPLRLGEESLRRGSARVVDAQREMALLRSGLESEWDSQARRRLIGDAHARLQYGEVTEVTELTTVVQIVTVEQTGCCCGCSNDTECKDRSRGGSRTAKPMSPVFIELCPVSAQVLTKRKSEAGIETGSLIPHFTRYYAHSWVSIKGSMVPELCTAGAAEEG